MQLSEKYRIVEDENNVILQFFEIRTKNKKDGTQEEFEFIDNWYYPNLKAALLSFVQKEIKYSKSIDEVIAKLKAIEELILSKFKKQ